MAEEGAEEEVKNSFYCLFRKCYDTFIYLKTNNKKMKNKTKLIILFALPCFYLFFGAPVQAANSVSECQMTHNKAIGDTDARYKQSIKSLAEQYESWKQKHQADLKTNLKNSKTSKAKNLAQKIYNSNMAVAKKQYDDGLKRDQGWSVASKKTIKTTYNNCVGSLSYDPTSTNPQNNQVYNNITISPNPVFSGQMAVSGQVDARIASFVINNYTNEPIRADKLDFSLEKTGLSQPVFSDFWLTINGNQVGAGSKVKDLNKGFNMNSVIPANKFVNVDLYANVAPNTDGAIKVIADFSGVGMTSASVRNASVKGGELKIKTYNQAGISVIKNSNFHDNTIYAGGNQQKIASYRLTNTNQQASRLHNLSFMTSGEGSNPYTISNLLVFANGMIMTTGKSFSSPLTTDYLMAPKEEVVIDLYADIPPSISTILTTSFSVSTLNNGSSYELLSNSAIGQKINILAIQ